LITSFQSIHYPLWKNLHFTTLIMFTFIVSKLA